MTDRLRRVPGTAVEMVKHDDDSVDLRDNPGGPALRFSPLEWTAFLEGIKQGEFDLPSDVSSQH